MNERARSRIASASNERYRRLAALLASGRERRGRRGEARAVLEGVHLLQAWADRYGGAAGSAEIFVPEAALRSTEIVGLLARFADAPTVLEDRLFARVSRVEHGIGPIAVVPVPRLALPERIDGDAVYLDRIQDPGNVGSILRTCAAVGVASVLASPGCAACWSPKVLRAGMGAHFHLAIHEDVDARVLRERCVVCLRAADTKAPASLYDTDLRAPAVWLLGNEGQGLSAQMQELPGLSRVSIPQTAGVESLNVGVAGALCLYEQWRQRRSADAGAAAS